MAAGDPYIDTRDRLYREIEALEEAVALLLACSYCNSPVEWRCRSRKTGNVVPPHSPRRQFAAAVGAREVAPQHVQDRDPA